MTGLKGCGVRSRRGGGCRGCDGGGLIIVALIGADTGETEFVTQGSITRERND